MANLEYRPALGRAIRIGEPPEQLGRSTVREIHDAIDAGRLDEAKALVESFRLEVQLVTDVYVDWVWAMLTWVRGNIDEAAVERIMRETLGSWVSARYANHLDLTPDERIAFTVEAMRGHLGGPGRIGDVEVVDEGERVVISFDPCGSGGRARRGDPEHGIPAAVDRPEFGFAEEAHDWTWGEEGVCLYCSHCSLVNEILPMERIGFPIRVTEYPRDAADKCRWIIYRDPRDVPASAYERVGMEKPTPEELEARWAAVRAERAR